MIRGNGDFPLRWWSSVGFRQLPPEFGWIENIVIWYLFGPDWYFRDVCPYQAESAGPMFSWHCHPQVTRLYGEGPTNWPDGATTPPPYKLPKLKISVPWVTAREGGGRKWSCRASAWGMLCWREGHWCAQNWMFVSPPFRGGGRRFGRNEGLTCRKHSCIHPSCFHSLLCSPQCNVCNIPCATCTAVELYGPALW